MEIKDNIFLILWFIVYSVMLVLVANHNAFHNGRIAQCESMGLITMADYTCLTSQEYNNMFDINTPKIAIKDYSVKNFGGEYE